VLYAIVSKSYNVPGAVFSAPVLRQLLGIEWTPRSYLPVATMLKLTLANTAAACVAAYFIISGITTWIRRRRFAKAHGCEPPTRLPQTERIIGVDLFTALQTQTKSKTLLPTGVQMHRELGNTFSGVLLGQPVLITIEPENVKAVLATQFHDFGIGTRHRGMGALLGHGIFSSDGSRWEHSRVGLDAFHDGWG
jgi:hypothetical protein